MKPALRLFLLVHAASCLALPARQARFRATASPERFRPGLRACRPYRQAAGAVGFSRPGGGESFGYTHCPTCVHHACRTGGSGEKSSAPTGTGVQVLLGDQWTRSAIRRKFCRNI